ncbi:MAG: hypothetical protein IPN19_02365 [Elusimicrobia bacterium]|nr:hypothetical protein [Elusimicrobiota bacterium]
MDQTYELPQDLIKNKEYRVRVEAVGHNMKRVSSAERSGTTNSDRPGAVVLVVNGEEPTRKMVLTWTPNGNDEGTTYRVELSSTDFVGDPVESDELAWSIGGKTFGPLGSKQGV